MQTINEQTKIKKANGDKLVPPKYYNDMDQAKRVGWRIIKDWLEAQLAIIELRQVKLQQAMLPYLMGNDGKTLYEHIEGIGFKGYLLEDKTEE